MLLAAILACLNVVPVSSEHSGDLQRIKSSCRGDKSGKRKRHLTHFKPRNSIANNVKEPKGIDMSYSCIRVRILLLVGLVCIGCYCIDAEKNLGLRDFSLLKNVIEASTTCQDTEESSGRQKRDTENMENTAEDEFGVEPCLDEADPIYYVSKYHRAVCLTAVNLAFEVFYARQPGEQEFETWFEKCVSREIDEAYMMWKFAENDEHLELLEAKRNEKRDREEGNHNSTQSEDDDGLSVPIKLRMPDQEFTEDLNDPESEEFQQLSDDYSEALVDILGEDVPGLKGVKVLGFANGSLIVFYELIFDDDVETVQKLYDDEAEEEQVVPDGEIKPFDPAQFAEKVKDKVKGVIKEALSNPEERNTKLNNTILADAHVDLESLETIPQDVVEKFVELNPSAPIVRVDLTTHHHEDTTDHAEVTDDVDVDESDEEEIIVDIDIPDTELPEEDIEVDIEIEVTTEAEAEATSEVDMTSEKEPGSGDNPVPATEANGTEESVNSNEVETTLATETIGTEAPLDEENTTSNSESSSISPSELETEYLDSIDDYDDYDYDNDVTHVDDDITEESNIVETTTDVAVTTVPVTDAITTVTERSNGVTTVIDDVMPTIDDVIHDSNATQASNDSLTQLTSPSESDSVLVTPENHLNSSETETETMNNTTEDNPLPNDGTVDMLSQTVVMKLRVTNMNYTKNLTDRQSEEFQRLEVKFTQMLKPLLQGMEGFLDMEVVGFSYGSLIVNNELHFQQQVPTNVKEDVKQRIQAAAGYFKYAHVDVDPDATEVLKPEEADLCEFVQCHLYADCVVKNNYRTECVCRPGFISIDPANCVSICDLEPGYCRNGGNCQVVPGRGAVCRCKVSFNWGYQGERCEDPLPRSVLLVSASTGVACVTFMLILALSAYFFYRKRKISRAKEERSKRSDKDFMRAAQLLSLKKKATPRTQRNNPIFRTEDETPTSSSGTEPKELLSSASSSPGTSTSSLNKSIGTTSTSSFFIRNQLEDNGPLPGDMNTPERKMLRLQVQRYPNHKTTWCEDDREGRKREQKKRTRRMRHEESTVEEK